MKIKTTFLITLMLLGFSSFAVEYPYKTLQEAFDAAKFNPAEKGSSFFVVTADLHVTVNVPPPFTYLIKELNAMRPAPAFFVVDGDMIRAASRQMGMIPSEADKKRALNEFELFNKEIDQIDKRIPIYLVLGNHDTYPREMDRALFHTVFPDKKVYQSFDQNGVHFIFLNGGGEGDIDAKQFEWLKKDSESIPKDQTVVIFAHQPSLGSLVYERGIASSLKKLFSNHKGEMWMIAGHLHRNALSVFKLGNAKIARAIITTGSDAMWGSEKPGYWIYCVKDGHVVDRIFRRDKMGYRIDKKSNFNSAKGIPEPFAFTKGILWKKMIGDGDRKYLVESDARDVVSWWVGIKKLTYRLPLNETGNKAGKVAILCSYPKKEGDTPVVALSSDNKNWSIVKLLSPPKNKVNLYEIPENLIKAKDIYVRLETSRGACSLGGFALCE